MIELTTFAKINLAACAARRAQSVYMDKDRFHGEFDTAALWKNHKVVQTVVDGRPWGYVSMI